MKVNQESFRTGTLLPPGGADDPIRYTIRGQLRVNYWQKNCLYGAESLFHLGPAAVIGEGFATRFGRIEGGMMIPIDSDFRNSNLLNGYTTLDSRLSMKSQVRNEG